MLIGTYRGLSMHVGLSCKEGYVALFPLAEAKLTRFLVSWPSFISLRIVTHIETLSFNDLVAR